ncbi:MAG: 50S ribosomal protein L3 [Chloroflexi bacterium HGW-Chloroflexi-1]|nr:MAG: 50S ribosomal protein L3 [Chloroflexi bacterium HGW-Chloroflexi-1]
MKGILGRKAGMTQLLTASGVVVPVTIIEAGPCYVAQIKSAQTDGYDAIQLGFDEIKPKRLTKGQLGHLRCNDLPALRVLREIRLKNIDDYAIGQKLDAEVFAAGERVDVMGVSKGRGFQGGVKRHGFRGGPRTHGQSDRLRAPGAIGSGTTPGRVYKGKRMPGHMGNASVTISNLQVVLIDAERNLLAVRGAAPGAKGGLLLITEARKQG